MSFVLKSVGRYSRSRDESQFVGDCDLMHNRWSWDEYDHFGGSNHILHTISTAHHCSGEYKIGIVSAMAVQCFNRHFENAAESGDAEISTKYSTKQRPNRAIAK